MENKLLSDCSEILHCKKPRNQECSIKRNLYKHTFDGETLSIGAFAGVIFQAAYVGLLFLITIVLARQLGAVNFGRYTLVMSIIMLLSTVSSAGIPVLILREFPIALEKKNKSEIKGLLLFADLLLLGMGMIIGLCVLASFALNWTRPAWLNIKVVVASAGFLLLNALMLARTATLIANGKTILGQFLELVISNLVFLGLIVILCFGYGHTLTLELTFILQTAGAATAFTLAQIYRIRCMADLQIGSVKITIRWRNWSRDCIPLSLTNGLASLQQNSLILLIGHIGSAEAVAMFRVADRISALGFFLNRSISKVVAPVVARLWQRNETGSIQSLLKAFSALNFFFCALLLILGYFGGEYFIRITFGASFIAAYGAMITLLTGLALVSIFGFNGMLLTMTHHAGMVTSTLATIFPITLVISTVMIYIYDLAGAALSLTISWLFVQIVLSTKAYAKTGIDASFLSFRALKKQDST